MKFVLGVGGSHEVFLVSCVIFEILRVIVNDIILILKEMIRDAQCQNVFE